MVAGARLRPQLGGQRPGDHGPPRQRVVVVAERVHQARGVGEQVLHGDPALVLRYAGEEAVDRVGHPQPTLHLQLDHGRSGELLGHRPDVVDGVAARRRHRSRDRLRPSRDRPPSRRRRAPPGCRSTRRVRRTRGTRRPARLLLGRRLVRLARREQQGRQRGPRPPSSVADASPADGVRLLCSVQVQPSRTRASTSASVSAHSPTQVNRSSSTRPLWAAADQVRKVRATRGGGTDRQPPLAGSGRAGAARPARRAAARTPLGRSRECRRGRARGRGGARGRAPARPRG